MAATFFALLFGSQSQAQEELPLVRSDEVISPDVPVPQADDDDDPFETLTRGPIHEAFAEAVSLDPSEGIVVPKEPPAPIDEVPPEFRPENEGMIWISGYWAWDDDRDDFIWISGVYRLPPEGQRWVPGYWDDVDNGWQWVSGFWVDDEIQEITYIDPPPTTLEIGPSSPAPSANHFYIPGNWSYSQVGYRWQAGYWSPMNDGMVWVPARYVWTPNGYVFLNGYWDYRLSNRGYCFAPTYFPTPIYQQTSFYYQPRVILNTNSMFHHLFIRTGYHHYFFGNYYGVQYSSRQIVPAYVYHQTSSCYDPLMSYYSAFYASQGRNLMTWYGDWHHQMINHPQQQPAMHWKHHVQNRPNAFHEDNIAYSLKDIANSKAMPIKFKKQSDDDLNARKQQAQEWRRASQDRKEVARVNNPNRKVDAGLRVKPAPGTIDPLKNNPELGSRISGIDPKRKDSKNNDGNGKKDNEPKNPGIDLSPSGPISKLPNGKLPNGNPIDRNPRSGDKPAGGDVTTKKMKLPTQGDAVAKVKKTVDPLTKRKPPAPTSSPSISSTGNPIGGVVGSGNTTNPNVNIPNNPFKNRGNLGGIVPNDPSQANNNGRSNNGRTNTGRANNGNSTIVNPANPGIVNPGVVNPGAVNPGIVNQGTVNPRNSNPRNSNPGITIPNNLNPNAVNPNAVNPNNQRGRGTPFSGAFPNGNQATGGSTVPPLNQGRSINPGIVNPGNQNPGRFNQGINPGNPNPGNPIQPNIGRGRQNNNQPMNIQPANPNPNRNNQPQNNPNPGLRGNNNPGNNGAGANRSNEEGRERRKR